MMFRTARDQVACAGVTLGNVDLAISPLEGTKIHGRVADHAGAVSGDLG
jgi:hypothetical protein